MDEARLVGDYKLGPRIGSGSFAVVWQASHRSSGSEVAVKEIDKKLLSPKVKDNLLKEISILSTINHPNIIRFYEAIETNDRIYLVLEYCGGGDLAGYISRHGKVSENVARHFMKQLAAGLQVLQEKHLIHRDLKPQNLLLSTNEVTPLLKIGDFGFARSLTPQNLAETFCGSPLYMAPEIIQNQKYDAKADLWSAGAILFQLVTGKPPFDGNNHIQLFQNIVRGTDLRFPEDGLQKLHPDCIDLCRSLLRRNPIERLTFREFFNHKFLRDPRPSMVNVEQTYPIQRTESRRHFDSSTSREKSLLPSVQSSERGNSSSVSTSQMLMPLSDEKMGKSTEGQCSSNQPTVVDSLELIEREYVLVNPHSVSMETSSDTSLQETGLPSCLWKRNDGGSSSSVEEQRTGRNSSLVECPQPSTGSYQVMEIQRSTTVHPPTKLKLLHQYAQTLTEVARDLYNAGQIMESFGVDLIVLAIWTKALKICDSWMISTGHDLQSTSQSKVIQGLDFNSPATAKARVAEEFVISYNQAEKSSTQLKESSSASQMPDAMEIIYEKALTYGKSGGVEECMNNKADSATLYNKAIVLLSFLVDEAMTLPLNPPFSLTPDNKKRILFYISNLQYRQSHL